MVRKKTALIGAGAIVALALTGCSSENAAEEHPAGHAASSSTAAAGATAANAQTHNDADVTFAQQMVPHHEQAVEMSDLLLAKRDIDPRVTGLATEIKAAQGPEIEQLQRWLKQWGAPPAPAGADHGDHGGMSGMMTEQDMTALRDAQGADASKLFLTQMIAHHEGAIVMAQTEIDAGQDSAAVEMARSIVDTQQREIDTMKNILGEL